MFIGRVQIQYSVIQLSTIKYSEDTDTESNDRQWIQTIPYS